MTRPKACLGVNCDAEADVATREVNAEEVEEARTEVERRGTAGIGLDLDLNLAEDTTPTTLTAEGVITMDLTALTILTHIPMEVAVTTVEGAFTVNMWLALLVVRYFRRVDGLCA